MRKSSGQSGFGLLQVIVAGGIMAVIILTMFGSINYMAKSQKNVSSLTGFDSAVGSINRLLSSGSACPGPAPGAFRTAASAPLPLDETTPWPKDVDEIWFGSSMVAKIGSLLPGGMLVTELKILGLPIPTITCDGTNCQITGTLFMRATPPDYDSGGTGGATEKRARWIVSFTTDQTTNLITACSGASSGSLSGTGTTGRIALWQSGAVLDNSPLFANPPNDTGLVGVGTTTPSGKLEVLDARPGSFAFEVQHANGVNGNGVLIDTATINAGDAGLHVRANGGSVLIARSDGRIGINQNNPTESLHVVGNILASGAINANSVTAVTVTATSDARFKRDIRLLEGSLEKVLRLRGVSYDWRTQEFPQMRFERGRDFGLIAQEVEVEFPEAISTGKDGYKGIAYGKLVAPLIEAVKEIWANLTRQDSELEALRRENADLRKRLEVLERRSGIASGSVPFAKTTSSRSR